ncbi:MAG: hypothetical protein WDM77_19190 [Steroidobacteraceae bacterium]
MLRLTLGGGGGDGSHLRGLLRSAAAACRSLAYLLCFALLTLILIWHRRLDAQGRYLDYRALAEGLRVQFYWRLAGLTDNASSSYLRKQLDELRWIREALRATGAVPPPLSARADLALKCWIHGQADYYATPRPIP